VTLFDGIPAWRYEAPDNVFSYTNNVDNQCFCTHGSGTCPTDGLFNSSSCAHGAPIFTSFPHFYLGDPKLLNATIAGLKPDAKKHSTYADIHPRLAFPIDGASRFQVNIQVAKSSSISGKCWENNTLACLKPNRACQNHTRECQNHTLECQNHTRVSESHTRRSLKRTLRVEITLCVWKSHSACVNHTLVSLKCTHACRNQTREYHNKINIADKKSVMLWAFD
jgi:hypothetical protein